jgi:Putative Actinobacterial Holin-X, holin superfamily III
MDGEKPVLSDLSGYVNRVAKLLRLDATLLAIETKQNLQSVGISVGLIVAALAVSFLGVVVLLLAIVLLLIQLGLRGGFGRFFGRRRALRSRGFDGRHRGAATQELEPEASSHLGAIPDEY